MRYNELCNNIELIMKQTSPAFLLQVKVLVGHVIYYFPSRFSHSSALSKFFGEQDRKTQWTMQHHYLFAWLAIVVGYPCLVTHSWMAYHQSPIAHVCNFLILEIMTSPIFGQTFFC